METISVIMEEESSENTIQGNFDFSKYTTCTFSTTKDINTYLPMLVHRICQ